MNYHFFQNISCWHLSLFRQSKTQQVILQLSPVLMLTLPIHFSSFCTSNTFSIIQYQIRNRLFIQAVVTMGRVKKCVSVNMWVWVCVWVCLCVWVCVCLCVCETSFPSSTRDTESLFLKFVSLSLSHTHTHKHRHIVLNPNYAIIVWKISQTEKVKARYIVSCRTILWTGSSNTASLLAPTSWKWCRFTGCPAERRTCSSSQQILS